MSLNPSSGGTIWPELPRTGTGPEILEAGYRLDVDDNWYPSSEAPFDGVVVDLAGDGNFTLVVNASDDETKDHVYLWRFADQFLTFS